ncbi:CPBP family intramembrane glutamic endopeptidase [Fulvivirga sedimenti]|uniref:CPBP family intramembrane metalloprotease n=1 Tax=Fulvivirga sedimenti TaxID=2879465 RepID=A0A9X1HUH4_9BACT|nr:CPBP family intramembrane metalloprotease [Fulvivirga sedimenti]MCA6076342.1 CPBP family intramembrane metalloprotease [Fulvivirga sedimenti]MCA6077470.1 CPBP family intramembrane metalloprotease [Fulvivirga sedimenti]
MFSQPEYVLPGITAAIFAVAYPLFCVLTFRKTYHKIKTGRISRLTYYQRSIALLMLMVFIVVVNHLFGTLQPVIWFSGINNATIVFSILITLFILAQIRQKIKPADALEIRSGMEEIWIFIPKSPIEYKWFVALSITAGICEEIIFRYYLYHYFHLFLPAPVSILILNFLFALSRIQSGFQNMVGAFVLGLIFSVIYYFSGFLILPIILHTAIEIQTGTIGFRIQKYINSQSL